MKKLNLRIEVNNKYWDEFCSVQHAINDLIDLVNSQQEAIGELQTEIGVLRNMVLQSQEAIEKLESKVWTAGFIEKYRPALEFLAEADTHPHRKRRRVRVFWER
jgi:hypothetical protein